MRKGFASADEVERFLHPRLKSLSDPFLLPNMQATVDRILDALDHHEHIVLFGDYDVDGVTSLVLLAEIFAPMVPSQTYFCRCEWRKAMD